MAFVQAVKQCDDTCNITQVPTNNVFNSISDALQAYNAMNEETAIKKQKLQPSFVENTDLAEQVHANISNKVEYWSQFGFMDKPLNISKVVNTICKHVAGSPVEDDGDDEDACGYDDMDDGVFK